MIKVWNVLAACLS